MVHGLKTNIPGTKAGYRSRSHARSLHRDPVLQAIKAGIPVIIQEKPMASTVPDAKQMLEAREKAGARIFVNYANLASTSLDRARTGFHLDGIEWPRIPKIWVGPFTLTSDGWRLTRCFVDAVIEDTLTPSSWAKYRPLPTAIDGLRQTQIVCAIVESAERDGKSVAAKRLKMESTILLGLINSSQE